VLIWSLLLSLVAALVAARVVAWRFDVRIARDVERVVASPPLAGERVALPPLLDAFVARAGTPGGSGTRWFRVTQQGEMRLQPGEDWRAFTAEQVYAVSEPAFVWHADFGAFRVVDQVVDGVGRLEARVFGVLPVARADGAEATRAQLLRYLAELVWVPRAFSDNRSIRWRQAGPGELVATLAHAGHEVELRFTFDEAGDVCRVEGVRECGVEGHRGSRPWVGRFSDYRQVGGVRVPTRGEVEWRLDSGPFVYWRGAIVGLQAGP